MALNLQGQEICRQAAAAFKRKGSLDTFWQTSADMFYTERADFTVTKDFGESFASTLYSSEPTIFRRDFGNFIGAATRPDGREWFKMRARDSRTNELATVRKYLEPRDQVIRNLLYDQRSNFNESMVQNDHDWSTFGNSVTTVEERKDNSGFHFRTWHLKDCAWRENYDGVIDTMFRKVRQSVRNLCSRQKSAGWQIAPEVLKKLEKNSEDMVNCLHVLMPIYDYDFERKKVKFDWISAYIDEDHKFEMSCKEVPEFNYVVSRWFTVAESPYAFSPCVVCSLPDARTLQTMTWSILEAGEKAVEPPLIAMNEAILGGVDIRAGAVTWADQRYDERTGEVLRRLDLGGAPEFGEALRQGIVKNMMEAWHLNKLFMPQDGVERTAQESAYIQGEFLRSSQPIISPANTQKSGKLLDLVITMAIRLGKFGKVEDIPKELQDTDIDVTYDNPIEDAKRQAKTQGYRQALEINEAVQKMGDTKSLAQFDGPAAYRDAILGIGPPNWLLDENASETAIEEVDQAETIDGAATQAAALAEANAKAMPKPGQVPLQEAA